MGGCVFLISDDWYALKPNQRMARKDGRTFSDDMVDKADAALQAQIADYHLVPHVHTDWARGEGGMEKKECVGAGVCGCEQVWVWVCVCVCMGMSACVHTSCDSACR